MIRVAQSSIVASPEGVFAASPVTSAVSHAVELSGTNVIRDSRGAARQHWTSYQIIVDGEPGPLLHKRQAVLTMIQKLSQKGIPLGAVSKILPPSRLRVIPAQLLDTAGIEDALRAQGVNEPERYFIEAPFLDDGKTYVLTRMWGRGTEPTLSALRDTFTHSGVNFKAED